MSVIEAILAVVGVVFLVLLVVVPAPSESERSPAEDLARPYREGLHAAVRMQRVAQDLEQQIYAEAAAHMNAELERRDLQAQE